MLQNLLNLIFPRDCLGCGQTGSYFCKVCREKNHASTEYVCPICERRVLHGLTHYKCQSRYGLDGFLYGFYYKNEIRQAISRLKFKPYVFAAAGELIEYLLKDGNIGYELSLWSSNPKEMLLVPVPIHWYRYKERGFNQSEVLAKIIGEKLGTSVLTDLLKRPVFTPSQRKLRQEERKRNVAGIFAVDNKADIQKLKERPVILVDDIWTTGATLRSCGKVLKEAGFRKVYGITLAR